MTELPEHDGFETTVDKSVVAGVQGALDATFNDCAGSPVDEVTADLRGRLADAGVADAVDDAWVTAVAAHIAAGEPVVAEIRDEAPE